MPKRKFKQQVENFEAWDVTPELQNEYLSLLSVPKSKYIVPAGYFGIQQQLVESTGKLSNNVYYNVKLLTKTMDYLINGKTCFMHFDFWHYYEIHKKLNHSGFVIMNSTRSGHISATHYVTRIEIKRIADGLQKQMFRAMKDMDSRIQTFKVIELLIGSNKADACTLLTSQAATYFATGKEIKACTKTKNRKGAYCVKNTFTVGELNKLQKMFEMMDKGAYVTRRIK